jgi:hypothetical protein
MPYVNIPESKLAGGIALIVGKLQGTALAGILKLSTNIVNKLNRKGCPTKNEMNRTRGKLNQALSTLKKADSSISKFKSIPGKLKGPLSGLKAAYKLILAIPLPQGIGIPPGPAGGLIIGLPVNVTTKYADTMHLVKEFISQISEQVEGITAALEVPTGALKSLDRNLASADAVCKSCEVEIALREQMAKGNLNGKELADLGLYNEDNDELIFSTLGPRLLAGVSNDDIDIGQNKNSSANKSISDKNKKGNWLGAPDHLGQEYCEGDVVSYKEALWVNIGPGCHRPDISGKKDIGPPGIGPWIKLEDSVSQANLLLLNSLKGLEDSNIDDSTKKEIKAFIDTFKVLGEKDSINNSDYYHSGPNGEVYLLEIQEDPNSPPIAPLRFAVAKDKEGVVVLKGLKSFASKPEVLLAEIKFRIDNQLP